MALKGHLKTCIFLSLSTSILYELSFCGVRHVYIEK